MVPQVEAYAVPDATAPFETGFIAPDAINEGGAREFLDVERWPTGLQDTFVNGLKRIPIRFFICDDSGSMGTSDGRKIVTNAKGQKTTVGCTRWAELTNSLEFHIKLARAANAPTEFRLLNSAEPILLGNAQATGNTLQETTGYATLQAVFKEGPRGGTPLCRHIREVIARVQQMEQQLRTNRQLACVVIASDGEASDGDVVQAMFPLKHLPVWVVIRLCTNDDRVVDYWSNIDKQLELDMDVLDDFKDEAKEVQDKNPWLTYGEPLHRLREFGIVIKEFDFLDEKLLTVEQMKKISHMIYGHQAESFPPPEVDIGGFATAIQNANRTTDKQYCPVTKREKEWMIPSKLHSSYGKGGCTVC